MLTKIFPVDKIREADAFTIKNEPINSLDLMDRAAKECFIWLAKKASFKQSFSVFCGPGNNGGDGLAIARMLAKASYQVQVHLLNLNDKYSTDFKANLERLQNLENCAVHYLSLDTMVDIDIDTEAIIIDAIFGSGLNKNLKGLPQQLIKMLNQLENIKVSIDIPSGLFADRSTIGHGVEVFMADYTLSFQFPKLAFLFPENEMYIGEWQILDIGLSDEYIVNTEASEFFITMPLVSSLIKPRNKFSHKGHFGHLLIIAGDHTKMGAALLCSKAALRMGAGLVSLHHPKNTTISTAVPEVMSSCDESHLAFTKVPNLSGFSQLAIGPGIGIRPQTAKALKMLIQENKSPMVFDADALNILAENKTWLSFLPKNSILTPHIGEFNRLVGVSDNDFDRLTKAKEFAKKHQIYLIVKGANTMIVSPNSNVFFNSTGNAGMATAGSGDVLTGMISGLLAQGYLPFDAAVIGVFLHGLSGDLAAEEMGMTSLIASDIIDYISQAYKVLIRT